MTIRRKTWAAALLTAATATAATAQDFTIRTTEPRQTVSHFGASDAWSMQNVGLWDDTAQREQVADWLFSTENDDEGNPLGIGLSLWRFNLGAGSAGQGRESQINRDTRTECLINPDGSFDWNRQAGQRQFLRMAKARGVPHFLAFLNSAPVYFTANGLATNTGRGATINLRDDAYESFARFMARALKGIEQHDSIHFDYLSPVNEPDGHWNWTGPKQEGSPATNRETARLVRLTSQALIDEGMTTKVMVNESSDLRCLLGIYETNWERGNTISTFFSSDSTATWLGQTPNVPRLILGHSYWTNTPVTFMRKIREQLRDTCRRYGVGFWQSELCIMANDREIGGGGGYDFTMRTALYVARVMHHDLKFADAQSWSWWRACGGDYKDGLIRIWPREQRAQDSKLLWTMGNYSRFVRPGAQRHEVEGPEEPYGLMATAYRNVDGRWAVVVINYGTDSRQVTLHFDDARACQWQVYRTSDVEGENLRPVGTTTRQFELPPRSVTTFVEK